METCQKLRYFAPLLVSIVRSKHSPNDRACSSKRSFTVCFFHKVQRTLYFHVDLTPHLSPEIPWTVLVILGPFTPSGYAFCSVPAVHILCIDTSLNPTPLNTRALTVPPSCAAMIFDWESLLSALSTLLQAGSRP